MNRSEAHHLISNYMQAWLDQDLRSFLATLDEKAVVRECYRPGYTDRPQCERWFTSWHAAGNNVTQWTLESFAFDDSSETAAIEWEFTCWADGGRHSFFGSSHVHFSHGRIIEMNEYQMTKNRTNRHAR